MLKSLIITGFALAMLSGMAHARRDTSPAAPTPMVDTENWFMQAVRPQRPAPTLPGVFDGPQAPGAMQVAGDWEQRM